MPIHNYEQQKNLRIRNLVRPFQCVINNSSDNIIITTNSFFCEVRK